MLVAVDAGDHRCQHFVRVHPFDFKWVSRTVGEQSTAGELRPAVAFTEGMDNIQFGYKMCALSENDLASRFFR